MTMEDKKGQKRKYVLFKKDGADAGPKQCAFFSSDAGCRNGSSCMFLHSKDGKTFPTKATSAPAPVVEKARVPVAPVQIVAIAPPEAPTSNKKVKVSATQNAPSNLGTPAPKAKSGKTPSTDDDDSSSLLFGAVNVALNGYTPVSASLRRGPGKKRSGSVSSEKIVSGAIEVLGHNDTTKALSTSGTAHATMGAKSLSKNLSNKFDSVADVAAKKPAPAQVPVGVPPKARPLAPAMSAPARSVPVAAAATSEDILLHEALSLVSATKVASASSAPKVKSLQDLLHPGAQEWLQVVELTRASPKYDKDYLQGDTTGWSGAQPGNKEGYPVLAMDCEMCSTLDPVTNTRNSMQLIRFSLISQNEVLVDSLVNPEAPVADMRTNIHGITEAEVMNVQFTIRHAQAIMKAYCGEGTVIVGHAVYNDLRTLKFKHDIVVDTSYLYSVENEPGQAPSIRDISEAVLNNTMETIHDSVMDAKASLEAAEYVVKNGIHPPIQRSASSTARQLSAGLLIHRIPQGCAEQAISDMMVKLCAIMPTLVQPIQWARDNSGAENGKTMVFFPSKEHADLAFEGLPGPNRPDKSNRPQKRAYLKGGGYMCIRKNYA